MTCQKISIFEHQACQISLQIPNENIGDWLCYGSAIRKGYQECIHFDVEPDTVKNNFKITIPSIDVKSAALKFELYEYQIFLKNINSHQEFLVISGEIEVKKRTCIHDAEESISDTTIELEAIVGNNILEVAVSIAGGLSAYEIAKLHGFSGTEEDWILELQGAADAANEAKQSRESAQEEAQKSESFKNEALGYSKTAALSANNAQTFAETSQAAAEVVEQKRAEAEAAASAANSSKIAAENYENNAKESKEAAITSQLAAEQAALNARIAQSITEDAAGVAQGFAQRAAGAADEAVMAAAEAKAAEAGSAAAADAVRFDLLPMTLEWLEGRLEKMYGAGMCSLALAKDEGSLRVAFSLDMGAPQVEEAGALLERILPRNLVTEMYWDDGFPVNYTRLEYLESSGSQWMITDFVPNNESGVMARYINNSGNSVHPIVTKETVDGKKRGFSVATIRNNSTMTCVWGIQRDPSGHSASTTAIIEGQTNYLNSRTVIWYNRETNYSLKRWIKTGAEYPDYTSPLPYTPTVPFHFCKDLWYGSNVNFKGKLLEAKFSQGEQDVCIFVPALDDTGVPCMYDLLARKACYNSGSGQFIAGVETLEQLDAVLRGLPDYTGQDGGELHLRLSDTLYEAAVTSGIIEAAATSKNWQIAYDPTTEIAA